MNKTISAFEKQKLEIDSDRYLKKMSGLPILSREAVHACMAEKRGKGKQLDCELKKLRDGFLTKEKNKIEEELKKFKEGEPLNDDNQFIKKMRAMVEPEEVDLTSREIVYKMIQDQKIAVKESMDKEPVCALIKKLNELPDEKFVSFVKIQFLFREIRLMMHPMWWRHHVLYPNAKNMPRLVIGEPRELRNSFNRDLLRHHLTLLGVMLGDATALVHEALGVARDRICSLKGCKFMSKHPFEVWKKMLFCKMIRLKVMKELTDKERWNRLKHYFDVWYCEKFIGNVSVEYRKQIDYLETNQKELEEEIATNKKNADRVIAELHEFDSMKEDNKNLKDLVRETTTKLDETKQLYESLQIRYQDTYKRMKICEKDAEVMEEYRILARQRMVIHAFSYPMWQKYSSAYRQLSIEHRELNRKFDIMTGEKDGLTAECLRLDKELKASIEHEKDLTERLRLMTENRDLQIERGHCLAAELFSQREFGLTQLYLKRAREQDIVERDAIIEDLHQKMDKMQEEFDTYKAEQTLLFRETQQMGNEDRHVLFVRERNLVEIKNQLEVKIRSLEKTVRLNDIKINKLEKQNEEVEKGLVKAKEFIEELKESVTELTWKSQGLGPPIPAGYLCRECQGDIAREQRIDKARKVTTMSDRIRDLIEVVHPVPIELSPRRLESEKQKDPRGIKKMKKQETHYEKRISNNDKMYQTLLFQK